MELKEFAKNLDFNIYRRAVSDEKTVLEVLTDLAIENNFNGDHDIYRNMSKTDIFLARKEMKKNGEPIPKHIFEKMLSHFGINHNSTIKTIWTAGPNVLFPELISQTIHAEALYTLDYTRFFANIIRSNDQNYQTLTYTSDQHNRSLARRGDRAPFKEIHVTAAEDALHKKQYGATLSFDYNTMKSMRFSALKSKVLDDMGRQLAIDILDLLIYTAINGDGVTNGLDTDNHQENVTTTGAVVPKDIIKFITCLSQGYKINQYFARVEALRLYAEAFASMTNPKDSKSEVTNVIGLPFPAGERWDSTQLSTDQIIGIDTKKAINLITDDQLMLQETEQFTKVQEVHTTISMQILTEVNDREAIGALSLVSA